MAFGSSDYETTMCYMVLAMYIIICAVLLLEVLYNRMARRSRTSPDKKESAPVSKVQQEESWSFDESSYSFFAAGLYSGSPAMAFQGTMLAIGTIICQLAFLRVYAISEWAAADIATVSTDSAFDVVGKAVRSKTEAQTLESVTYITCGTFLMLSLSNDLYNGLRLLTVHTRIALLKWRNNVSGLVVCAETADASSTSGRLPPPPMHMVMLGAALSWAQITVALCVGKACETIIVSSASIMDIILNFLALLFIIGTRAHGSEAAAVLACSRRIIAMCTHTRRSTSTATLRSLSVHIMHEHTAR